MAHRRRILNSFLRIRRSKARYRVEDIIRAIVEFFQDQWFDLTRNVRTSTNAPLLSTGVATEEIHDSECYQPARPRHIRQALREMPIQDVSEFSYVDLGSGKGRSLFVAAELPFQRITGVEFSPLLHEQACANIRRFRPVRLFGSRKFGSRKRRFRNITSLHMNAKDFAFPEGKLVLYLFNPFGSATMRCVLRNLEASLQQHPRHVIIILLWPRCADQVAALQGMQLLQETRQYQIFEAQASKPLSPQRQNQSPVAAG
jgi:SAM-dependent methyltransferase